MGKNSRAATATTSNGSTDKKTTSKKTDGLTKQVADKAAGNFKLNGLPKPMRKSCNLTYKEICELYYYIIMPKLEELKENLKITKENLCTHDDGGNGIGGSSMDGLGIAHILNNDRVNLPLFKQQATMLEALCRTEKEIRQGTYSNKCKCGNFIPFVRLRLIPETNACMVCAR